MRDIQNMKNLRLKGMSLQSIGRRHSLTRERVRQLLVENYGSSLEKNVIRRVAKEVMEYQWDSGNAYKEAIQIAKRIHAIYHPMCINKNNPLSTLIFPAPITNPPRE